MAVPIRNLYYLLCYAWDRLDARDLVDAGALEGDRVEDLLARVLRDGVRQLIKRGLDSGYVTVPQDGRRLRGKLLVAQTAQRLLLQQGRVACAPDELTTDVPHNRVLKAAMRELAAVPGVNKVLRHELLDLCRGLAEVSDIPLRPEAFRPIRLNQNLARYAFLVQVARLVAGCLLPEQGGTAGRFRSFVGNDSEIGGLFEAFVRNFLAREQSSFRVNVRHLPWTIGEGAEDTDLLPRLKTDVYMRTPGLTVVMETKCVDKALVVPHLGQPKLRSGHLYQLLAYLSNTHPPEGDRLLGVLLYAGLGAQKPLNYTLCDHSVMVRNLNLDQPWEGIHANLVDLASELSSWPKAVVA